jgi:drug/metabolite transporter (DMT)-like permease
LPFINKTFNTKINYNFNNNKKYYKLLLILTIFGIISSFSYFYLLNLSNVRKMTSYFNPLKILSIVLISYFLFNEKITFGSFVGISFIIIGLIITAYFDK